MENYFWFAFLVILLIVISIVIFRDLKKWNFSDEYKLFHRVYSEYKSEVLGDIKSYDKFVFDFRERSCSISGNNEVNLNKRRAFSFLMQLLERRADLVEKYFDKDSFTYGDLKELKKEFDATFSFKDKDVAQEEEVDVKSKVEDYVRKCYESDGIMHVPSITTFCKKESGRISPKLRRAAHL